MASMEKLIFEAVASKLAGLSWIKTINYELIRLNLSDFQEHELPAVQFYDEGEFYNHAQSRVKTDWNLTVELIMKQNVSGLVNQVELFEKKFEVELQIGHNVRLGLENTGIIHVQYLSSVTDLHTFEPFYIARLLFNVQFYKEYTAPC